MSERREADLVWMRSAEGQRIVVDASDEEFFSRLVAGGWELQEDPVESPPGALSGHATSVASRSRRRKDAT